MADRDPLLEYREEQANGDHGNENPVLDEEPMLVYVESNDRGRQVPYTNCNLCHNQICVKDQMHLNIVRCPACREWTAIQPPPEGKRYVRCPCHLLSICRSSATQYDCRRRGCNRRIQLRQDDQERRERFECAYCNHVFEMLEPKKFGRCNFCGNRSNLGQNYTSFRAFVCVVIGMVWFAGGVVIALLTYKFAMEEDHWPVYVAWAFCGLMGFSFFMRAAFYSKIKTSNRVLTING